MINTSDLMILKRKKEEPKIATIVLDIYSFTILSGSKIRYNFFLALFYNLVPNH